MVSAFSDNWPREGVPVRSPTRRPLFRGWGRGCHAWRMVYRDDATPAEVVLPAPCLVVLVGMSGSGKSTWAGAHFAPEQIVSSDILRAVVGAGEDDITASDDAFA